MIDMVPLRGRLVEHTYADLMEDAREADMQEWEAASGQFFHYALILALSSYANTGHAWVAKYGPHILMAFGVVEQPLRGIGNAWMLCTNRAVTMYRAIHQHWHKQLDQMLAVRPILHAWADERNVLHHQWMLRMGFQHTGVTSNYGQYPFRLFVYSKELHQASCVSPARAY